ncbi:MAG TPA: hypothetical protein ENL02_00955 [Epsilonproteobacteria bacterium]|nr:hypothetical protein [Campylobacterota bacterium]
MKNRKTFFNILLVVLLVWTAQSATMHFHKHTLHGASDCKTCLMLKQLQSTEQSGALFLLNDYNIAVQISEEAEKILVRSAFNYKHVSVSRPVKIVQNSLEGVASQALGYRATAPPVIFS